MKLMRRLSIGPRLGVMTGTGMVLLLGLAVPTVVMTGDMRDETTQLGVVVDGVRAAMEADMAHDASNAAVILMRAAADEREFERAVEEFNDTSARLVESLDKVGALHLSSAADDAVAAVRPTVDEYIAAGRQVAEAVRTGGDVRAAAERFATLFEDLVEQLPTVADAVETQKDVTFSNAEATASHARNLALVLGLLMLTAFPVFTWFVARSITVPLGRTKRVLGLVATGDLTERLEVEGHDEIAQMGEALNQALDGLGTTMVSIEHHSAALAAAAEELTTVSSQLAGSARETSVQAEVVSAAAGQVSASVSVVATGTGEMNQSILEIATGAQDAVGVAEQARLVAETTNTTVAKLGESSAEIGNVIKVITSIAEQTNLLALNASIEAARAGEAGKGFAVVAHDVKELASATADATADISHRISAIQHDVNAAVAAIGSITEIIGRVSETQTTIASAVEEQTATTTEIGRNVNEAADNTTEIARNISSVAQAAQDASAGATQTLSTATELSRMAGELQALVSGFRC